VNRKIGDVVAFRDPLRHRGEVTIILVGAGGVSDLLEVYDECSGERFCCHDHEVFTNFEMMVHKASVQGLGNSE
jgi:hypothetical protein